MKNYFCKRVFKPITVLIIFTFLISLKSDYLNAEYLFEELEIDNSTKTEDDGSIGKLSSITFVSCKHRISGLTWFIQSIICESLVLMELTFHVAINKFLPSYVKLS